MFVDVNLMDIVISCGVGESFISIPELYCEFLLYEWIFQHADIKSWGTFGCRSCSFQLEFDVCCYKVVVAGDIRSSSHTDISQ